MKKRIDVTIAVTLVKDEAINEAGLLALRQQSLSAVEILTSQEGEAEWELRNRAIKEGRGRYIVFLNVRDRYYTEYILELLCHNAIVEEAKVCGGRALRKENGKLIYPDNLPWTANLLEVTAEKMFCGPLICFIYNRKWLLDQHLLFTEVMRDIDYVICANALAGEILSLGKTLAIEGWREKQLTQHEEFYNLLNGLGTQIDCALASNSEVLKEYVNREVFVNVGNRIRNILWEDGLGNEEQWAYTKAWLAKYAEKLDAHRTAEMFYQPTVSIIVPSYNVEKYLARCLDSLVAQTLTSIEIICVDDGSTDATPLIADRYAEMNTKIKVIHQANGGRSAARNAGMAVATGKYIGFIDGDDWIDAIMFERMADALDKHDDVEIAMCGAVVDYEYEVEQKEKDYANQYFVVPLKGVHDLTPAIIHDVNASVCTRLFRRDFLNENKILFPLGMDNEDEVFSFFTLGRAKRMYFIQENWYHYIRNASGIMAQQVKDSVADNTLPDALTKALPLIAYYLEWDDRRDLLGVFWRRLCGASSRFAGNENALRIVAKLLRQTRFYYRRDFLDLRDIGWISNRLCELYNYNSDGMELPPVDVALLPKPLEKELQDVTDPVLSFIVPVYNIEQNISYCVESLRKQTLNNIEMIFIDDGSEDASLEILRYYQAIDSRIRVLAQENSGVSIARNRGIQEAKGKYISVIDGDDWIDRLTAEKIVAHCEEKQLDVCYFDFICFDDKTRKSIDHWYTFANRKNDFPIAKVFAPNELKAWLFNGGACCTFFRRDFIIKHGLSFPSNLKVGEDGCFTMRYLPLVKRAYIEPSVFYHYRRGRVNSAVTTLTAGVNTEEAISQQLAFLQHTIEIYQQVYVPFTTVQTQRCFLKRLLIDILFYVEKSAQARKWLFTTGFDALGLSSLTRGVIGDGMYNRMQKMRALFEEETQEAVAKVIASVEGVVQKTCPSGTPMDAQEVMARIEEARATSQKDYYIVMGQLNSKTNEPIDSWTFFQWLQRHDVPSCYVMWKEHKAYEEFSKYPNVIALEGDGVADYEFIEKCESELIRAKAVVAENGAINSQVAAWLRNLTACEYVFLQHGVIFAHLAVVPWMMSHFNSINVASERERDKMLSCVPKDTPTRLFIGGLPRMDLLTDLSHEIKDERVVFIMFTWRSSFNQGMERIKKSAWWHFLMALISEHNVARLKKKRVRFVLAMHHHILNMVSDLELPDSVEFVDASQISYWIKYAKMCVTDFSSVFSDFIFLDKPVIFSIPDEQDMLLDPKQIDDGAKVASAIKNLREVPCRAKSVTDMVELIEFYADRDFKMTKADKIFADSIFKHRKGISQAVYEQIECITAESEVAHV